MDPFVLVLLGFFVALLVWILVLGRYHPGSGMREIGWSTSREVMERREALEAEDLEQMIAAHNARRRARGEAEITAEQMELRVAREQAEQRQRREAYLAERELDELLEATNARRRARGLPERTREDVQREFGS